ncbi:hypothetical protein L3X38_041539 [Prunus dulcis]|uniref:Uncharacterized protein n=1 Tax=Prunus dulcis TaxID=3755 RepID=A0AAD4YKB8_PRUDU|nr:hypothetical protein L3X38_041539 [Prunus dulcis]
MYGVNRRAGAMSGGRSRVEKIWRVEREKELRIFFSDRIPNRCRLLTVLGVGFPVGMSLRFLLDPGCPTCINTGFVFTLSHIANLTCLLSSLRKILENLYLSNRGVAVHPKTVEATMAAGCY